MVPCFVHFMTMDRWMNFSGGVINRLLLRELHHEGPTDEMRFLLGEPFVENDIHQRHFGGIEEVSFEKLRVVLTLGEFQEAYDTVKLYLIYMLNWILMRLDERFKIPVWQFRLVKNLDEFDAFPWGAHVYRHIICSFKHALDGRPEGFERRQQAKGTNVHTVETYNIYGLSHTLLVIASIDRCNI
ncbi:hypothetical protein Ddye_009359 [Dipteronia dyeriana]|uniref:DUF1985 domain-containing protein n=1 Tax=Dipteronia dyeriana TaxID=168575 RepID=A0AAE0CM64_9ROSI|nr:hypothetical protein Ddye_009359 [Dipteronia dyeriana]